MDRSTPRLIPRPNLPAQRELREPSRPVEQIRRLGTRAERAGEQLPDHPEGVLELEAGPSAMQYGEPTPVGRPHRLGQQRRLTDSGRTFQNRHAAGTGLRPDDQLVYPRQFALSAKYQARSSSSGAPTPRLRSIPGASYGRVHLHP